MDLCIFYSLKPDERGSFIDMHIDYLRPKLEVYFHKYPIYANGKLIFNFPMKIWFIRTFIKHVFPQLYEKIHRRNLVKILKKERIKVALAEYGPVGAAVSEACKEAGVPLVVHFHGFDAYAYDTIRKYKKSYKKMFVNVAGVVAVSEEMKRELMGLGAEEEKLKLIPCGVNLNLFSEIEASENEPIFIAVGRFTPKKAPDLTIKAFNIVVKEYPDARLLMVGEGSLLEQSRKLVEELGISDKVEFLGSQPHNKVAEYMGKSRVFVQHSLRPKSGDSEGSPVAIIEASARALPVVSTKHAGIPEIIVDGETGFLVDEGDYEKMGFFMKKFLEEPQLASQMGHKGRKHIMENYASEKQLRKLKDFLLSKSENSKK